MILLELAEFLLKGLQVNFVNLLGLALHLHFLDCRLQRKAQVALQRNLIHSNQYIKAIFPHLYPIFTSLPPNIYPSLYRHLYESRSLLSPQFSNLKLPVYSPPYADFHKLPFSLFEITISKQNKQNYIQSQPMQSVTTPTQIRNNPSNNSTAKYHWSFSKSPRFKTPRPNCPHSAYNSQSCLSNRRASFGYGSRSKYFDGSREVPQPGTYELPSDFKQKKKETGFSFTANRENLLFGDYTRTIEITPHPAAYERDSDQIKKKRAYSMRPKTAYPSNYFLPNQNEREKRKALPGPGKYETIEVIGGKYLTKPNCSAQVFSGGRRFHHDKTTPGPSDYPNKTIDPDGAYVLSNMRSSGRRSFLHGKRQLKLTEGKISPGPGSYRAPSDFGHYQSTIRPSTARA